MKKKRIKASLFIGVAGLILAGGYYAFRHLKQMRNESKVMVQQDVVPSVEQRVEPEAEKEIAVASVPEDGNA